MLDGAIQHHQMPAKLRANLPFNGTVPLLAYLRPMCTPSSRLAMSQNPSHSTAAETTSSLCAHLPACLLVRPFRSTPSPSTLASIHSANVLGVVAPRKQPI